MEGTEGSWDLRIARTKNERLSLDSKGPELKLLPGYLNHSNLCS
jgi:hypothetical protein